MATKHGNDGWRIGGGGKGTPLAALTGWLVFVPVTSGLLWYFDVDSFNDCIRFCLCFTSVPDCSCARKLPTGLQTDTENVTEPFNPIATNGEPFPWLNLTLPTNARPMRYMVTIHPNLTTLDVKGMCTLCYFRQLPNT